MRAALPEASRSNVRRICRPHLLRAPTTIHQVAASILCVPPSVVTLIIRLGNINPIPIDYGFRPRLRSRLTLRGLTLRRNPWIFGDRVSHSVCRYSCQHSHFRYLQAWSPIPFTGLRNAPLPRTLACTPAASVYGLSPDTLSAQKPLFRPVSCYAFFKRWLLLSQLPGCLCIPTSFQT